MYLIGNTGMLCRQYRGIEPHLPVRGMSHGFLELRQEPRVYSQVTARMDIRKSSCSSEDRTPV